MGGGEMMRAGRMLAQGDLRLIALALVAEQPRYGYEIIKLLEDKTAGWYSPSPGIVYPTLTYLEEVGYVTVQAEGAKKLYTITDEGRAYLEQNRSFVDAVLERLAAIGEKATRIREHFDRPEYAEHRGRRRSRDEPSDDRSSMPPLMRGALDNLREVASKRLEADEDIETRIVEVLMRAAQELKKISGAVSSSPARGVWSSPMPGSPHFAVGASAMGAKYAAIRRGPMKLGK
jgi:DNA-binding PadR family transcriptional regulator